MSTTPERAAYARGLADGRKEAEKSITPLRRTLDGFIVQRGDWVWYGGNVWQVDVNGNIAVAVPVLDGDHPTGDYRDIRSDECYSTRAAAEAAKEAKPQ